MKCKNCAWYYKEHCVNDKSEYCTENVGEDDTCKDFEEKGEQ